MILPVLLLAGSLWYKSTPYYKLYVYFNLYVYISRDFSLLFAIEMSLPYSLIVFINQPIIY